MALLDRPGDRPEDRPLFDILPLPEVDAMGYPIGLHQRLSYTVSCNTLVKMSSEQIKDLLDILISSNHKRQVMFDKCMIDLDKLTLEGKLAYQAELNGKTAGVDQLSTQGLITRMCFELQEFIKLDNAWSNKQESLKAALLSLEHTRL